MQGLYVGYKRPASKKAVKEAVAADPASVQVEGTSITGTDYDGPLSAWTGGKPIRFVGPDPYTSRKFYGSIIRKADGGLVVT